MHNLTIFEHLYEHNQHKADLVLYSQVAQYICGFFCVL